MLPALDLTGGHKWTPPEREIGKRINEAMQWESNGLTSEALSRLTKEYDPDGEGIAQSTISRYINADFLPGAREIRILCDALDVSPNWLILGVEDTKAPALDEVMAEIAGMVVDRIKERNPLRFPRSKVLRVEMLKRAKAPKQRK